MRQAFMQVHLIDGTYELFRAFFGAPSSTAPDGQEVGGTRGLARSLLNLLSDKQVTHLACAFDHVIESFRNQLFAGYKTGEGIEPALYSQFPLVEDLTRALGIVTWPMIEFETDDALATFAARCEDDPEVTRVLICSPDKDFAQCVRGERIVLLDRMRSKLLDEAGVLGKFGILPASIPDWLALVGDTADGIPGIPRWGAKSAAAVLAEYHHIEAIPDDPNQWRIKVRGAPALAASLAEARPAAQLYRTLATLRTDVPLEETRESLRWAGPDRPALEAFAARIGDSRLVELAERTYAERQ
ncbi:MAG: 5'-3' exonuclease H3TH domain-containing protein [Polyangiales bacterium]